MNSFRKKNMLIFGSGKFRLIILLEKIIINKEIREVTA